MIPDLPVIPQTGTTRQLAFAAAHKTLAAAMVSQLADARGQTLQQRYAPIVHLDLAWPFPNQIHPVVQMPDAGGSNFAAALEDQ